MEAPRWRLQEPHYLNVPGTEWDHKEMNQATRKQITKHYPVPLLLDPKEPTDWNYPEEIIVTHQIDGVMNMPRDIIFVGPPTLSMEPLNEAAMKLSNEVAKKSKHPIDSLPVNGFTEDLLTKFTRQLEAVVLKAGGYPQGLENQPVPNEQIDALQAQLNEAMEKIAKLERVQAQGEMAEVEPLAGVEVEDAKETPASPAQPDVSLAEHAQRAAAQAQGRRHV